MPTPSDQRSLATALATLDDAALVALFASRGVPASVGWHDLFDAAEGMLEPASIARGLSGLIHRDASALAQAIAERDTVSGAALGALLRAGLVDAEGRPFAAVSVAVRDRDSVLPVPDDAPSPPDASAVAAAAERAFTHTAALADILLRAIDAPLGRIGNGGLSAAERRTLVEAGAAPDADTADLLVGLADAVGLLSGSERAWSATALARTWVVAPTLERWSDAAVRLRDAFPPGLRSEAGGWLPAAAWPVAYPFDTAWPARASLWRVRAVAWGLLTPSGGEPPWAVPLAAGDDVDVPALERMLPSEVDRVYLQNDLTAIAPGPLAPALDVRLRGMARRESRAQASTYRFDADTVAAAITAGETAQSIRDFLGELSLTGLPQPLAYVIERTAARHGLVRVSADPSGSARVSSDDRSVLETIAVDQALRPLGLVRANPPLDDVETDDRADHSPALVSRASYETVFWALADARYPVIAVDEHGVALRVERTRAPAVAPRPAPGERYAELVGRLRAADGAEGDSAWLQRELDQAARARAIVDVVVDLPDGSTRTFRLEATGFGGGRLRGRDRGADVERTLPLSSIRSIHPVT